jgi:hypothetical protein
MRPAGEARAGSLTTSRATFPDDRPDRDALLRAAGRRLHAVEDARPASVPPSLDAA